MQSVIKVENLSKKFRIGRLRQNEGTLRDLIGNFIKRPFYNLQQNEKSENLWALNNVSFDIKQGDTLGIIGNNGAGKSTLLKILSRIIKPTSGRAILKGRVGSILEIGTGFHPDLTGRENIFLNGAVLGMLRREVEKRFDEIVAFSNLEKFLDTPVKFYSSGMYARLAFAVAAHLEPDILIVDEVLAVGDAAFQVKCLGKMGTIAEGGRTVLFVSHKPAAMLELCKTGLYLEKGHVKAFGNMRDVMSQYQNDYELNIAEVEASRNVANVKEGDVRFIEWRLLDSLSKDNHSAISREDVTFEFIFVCYKRISNIRFSFAIQDEEQKNILSASRVTANFSENTVDKTTYRLEWRCELPIKSGFYIPVVEAYSIDEEIVLDKWYCRPQLQILPVYDEFQTQNSHGLVNVPISLNIKRD